MELWIFSILLKLPWIITFNELMIKFPFYLQTSVMLLLGV